LIGPLPLGNLRGAAGFRLAPVLVAHEAAAVELDERGQHLTDPLPFPGVRGWMPGCP
jgi:hypothetical protein